MVQWVVLPFAGSFRHLSRQQPPLDQWDGRTGSEMVHPPCQRTPVERESWTNATEVRRLFEETYEPNADMVVALCRENTSHIVEFATALKIKSLYIYSKCGMAIDLNETIRDPFDTVEVTELLNVGREGHSFLTHLLREDLHSERWTVFLQGQIEKTLQQVMLSLLAAQQHEAANDGTDFINLYRVTPPNKGVFLSQPKTVHSEFCTPMNIHKFNLIEAHRMERYQSHRGSHKYLDFIGKQIFLRGEFVAKNTLFGNLDQDKIRDIRQRLETERNPLEGHYLERFWISILGAADNCRCEGMPLNHLPPLTPDMALGKPTELSESRWEVDLETIGIIRSVTITLPPNSKTVVEILDEDHTTIVASSNAFLKEEDNQEWYINFDYVEGRFVRISLPGTVDLQVKVTGYLTTETEPQDSKQQIRGWTGRL